MGPVSVCFTWTLLKRFGSKMINFPLIWLPLKGKTASNTIWKERVFILVEVKVTDVSFSKMR